MSRPNQTRGFTIVELTIGLVILGMLGLSVGGVMLLASTSWRASGDLTQRQALSTQVSARLKKFFENALYLAPAGVTLEFAASAGGRVYETDALLAWANDTTDGGVGTAQSEEMRLVGVDATGAMTTSKPKVVGNTVAIGAAGVSVSFTNANGSLLFGDSTVSAAASSSSGSNSGSGSNGTDNSGHGSGGSDSGSVTVATAATVSVALMGNAMMQADQTMTSDSAAANFTGVKFRVTEDSLGRVRSVEYTVMYTSGSESRSICGTASPRNPRKRPS